MRQLASGNTLSTGRRGRCPKVGRVACRRAKRKLARWWLHAKGEGDLRWPASHAHLLPLLLLLLLLLWRLAKPLLLRLLSKAKRRRRGRLLSLLLPEPKRHARPRRLLAKRWLLLLRLLAKRRLLRLLAVKATRCLAKHRRATRSKPAGRLSKGWRCRRRTTTAAAKRIGRRRRCSKPWLASKRARCGCSRAKGRWSSWRGRRLRSKRKLRRWRCRWGRLARTKHKRAGRGWRATDSHAKPAWCLACRLPTKAPESTAKAWRCACWARRCGAAWCSKAGEARRGCALLRRRFGNRRRPKSKAACCCGCRLRCRWSSSKETAGRCWRSRSSRRERWSRTKCER
ncbi:hypothetical protein BC831DRAFT_475463 [Entophlyctis helioformis]|nr:hypothetical protein BC831DRAFT_475463 [Entophlyctis helioformis]